MLLLVCLLLAACCLLLAFCCLLLSGSQHDQLPGLISSPLTLALPYAPSGNHGAPLRLAQLMLGLIRCHPGHTPG